MSKFNKIYEYDYHLFGQVSEYPEIIKYAHINLYKHTHTVSDFAGFRSVSVLVQNVTVTMTSVSGHLLGLEFKAPFQKW